MIIIFSYYIHTQYIYIRIFYYRIHRPQITFRLIIFFWTLWISLNINDCLKQNQVDPIYKISRISDIVLNINKKKTGFSYPSSYHFQTKKNNKKFTLNNSSHIFIIYLHSHTLPFMNFSSSNFILYTTI